MHLRSMIIHYATASVRGSGRYQKFYRRLKKRTGHSKAIVATARKMLATVFVLLTHDCEYVDEDELNTRNKLRRMDRIAKDLADIDVETMLSNLSESVKEVLLGERSITDTG